MSIRNPSKAKFLQWRLECVGHTIIELIAGLLPGPWVFRVGEWLGGIIWPFMGKRRRIVIRNLRIAFAGEMEMAEIHRMAKASFCRTAANMLSLAYTARLSPDRLKDVLRVENIELLEQTLAKGRGVVLLLAHMGNWELLSRMVHFFPAGSKAGAMYRHLNNIPLDRRTRKRREADGTRMFSKSDSFHHIAGFLREGGIVGILADQRVAMQGDVVPFFGRLTRATPLPSLLARRAKAEVLALSLVTKSPGKWKAVFHPVEKPHDTKNCMATLERAMRSGPTDVFWLQERWKVYAAPHVPFAKWLDGKHSNQHKPHRALLWLTDAPENWSLPNDWRHPDLNYEAVVLDGFTGADWLTGDTNSFTPVVKGDPSVRELQDRIHSIDEMQPVPLDFILTTKISDNLIKATKDLSIPLIQLPS
jgi:KDO2-lipid IV(A) lauroyltransferase